jgi:hypothetical protein
MIALLLSLPIGLVVALALRGDVRPLASLSVRRPSLFYVALAVQIAAFPFGPLPWHVAASTAAWLWVGSYAILLAAALSNIRTPGVPVVTAGMLMNLAAILANGGRMPALPSALEGAGLSFDGVRENSVSTAAPHLALLVDRWSAPAWVPGANVFSLGDVVIGCGGVLVIVLAATRRPAPARRPWAPLFGTRRAGSCDRPGAAVADDAIDPTGSAGSPAAGAITRSLR